MSNALDDHEQQRICALGRLGWPLLRIQQATGVRRETVSGYLKAAGIPVRGRGRPSERTAKPATTERDLQTASRQKQQPWEIGKSFDQAAPCSAITPAGRVGHLAKGRIWLSVNGKVRQDSDLELMIWKVPDIISALSRQIGLAAGDLIYTGTPAGVAAVVKGDRMVGGIAGLEDLTITVT